MLNLINIFSIYSPIVSYLIIIVKANSEYLNYLRKIELCQLVYFFLRTPIRNMTCWQSKVSSSLFKFDIHRLVNRNSQTHLSNRFSDKLVRVLKKNGHSKAGSVVILTCKVSCCDRRITLNEVDQQVFPPEAQISFL